MNNATKAFRALLPLAIVACSSAEPTRSGDPGTTSGDGVAATSGSRQDTRSGDNTTGNTSGSASPAGTSSASVGDMPVPASGSSSSSGAPVDAAGPAPDAPSLPAISR